MKTTDQFKKSLETWQSYTQAYTDLALDLANQAFDQSLAIRQRFDEAVSEGLKKAQALSTQEQEIALDAVEALQEQVRTASERMSRLFMPASKS